MVEGGESTASLTILNAMNPAQSRMSGVFDELNDEIIRQCEEGGVPDGMLEMMNSFQLLPSTSTVETGNSPHLEQTGSYYEFSKSMRLRKALSVNSKTSFFDEPSWEINHGRNVSGNQVRLTQCKQSPCSVLTDHDEAYACWHPEAAHHQQKEQHFEHIGEVHHPMSARGLESSISTCGVRNQAQHSVSFAEKPVERTGTKQQFAVHQHSTSLSDPIFPSPIISPRLRGPGFFVDFEEYMLALPMPSAEHLVPSADRRSSTVSANPSGNCTMINLSSNKPTGFWEKLGALFKSCFGAR